MRDLGQIAQNGHRVGPIGILSAQLAERPRRIAAHDRLEQVEHPAPVGQAQHRAHLGRRRLARAMGDGLIQKAHGIAHRPFGGARDQRQRILGDLGILEAGDLLQMGDHHLGFDPPQIETLATRQDRHRHLADLGRGKEEFHVRRRFLQRLEQRVERTGREHVNLVDDEDLVARLRRAVADRFDDRIADILHAGVGGRVHFHHVDMAALGDRHAVLTHPARIGRRPARAIGPDAVQPLGDDPRGRCLAGAANPRQHEGLRDPVSLESVFQRAHHRILTDQVGECRRAILARQNLVAGVGYLGHCASGRLMM